MSATGVLSGMEHLQGTGHRPMAAPSTRSEHFYHAAGQGVMTYDEPMRFRGRETDPRNPHFNTEPSAHVEAHGFIRDNTASTRQAYKLRDDPGTWKHAETRTLHPAHPLHTLQTERETARPSQRPPGVGSTNPRVMRIRGKDVVVDGHHRIVAARAEGRHVTVDHLDTDKKLFGGMTHADMMGI